MKTKNLYVLVPVRVEVDNDGYMVVSDDLGVGAKAYVVKDSVVEHNLSYGLVAETLQDALGFCRSVAPESEPT